MLSFNFQNGVTMLLESYNYFLINVLEVCQTIQNVFFQNLCSKYEILCIII